ncbi:hypothetical protein IGL98_000959 [Enterococcus sp. DIV0840]
MVDQKKRITKKNSSERRFDNLINRPFLILASSAMMIFFLQVPFAMNIFVPCSFFYSIFLCTRKIYRILIDLGSRNLINNNGKEK